ncbi:MAG: CHAP domain-containing protein [Rhodospirillales bacterium]|nr:CHAP domain-containing protein [Alphaproteobacteria bacterium]MCB1839175.1 CHAP domain-containing protein [Alphaproteobacteria bacterium]MCB9976842.1 CHAP domain-containing protein [Rhodospirillales bacterium]
MNVVRFWQHTVVVCCFLLVLVGCSTASESAGPYATYYKVSAPIQCVPYARDVSGIDLRGNAYTWWDQAAQNNYPRGNKPAPGAVLVLRNTGKLRYGHLAVVNRIVSAREIDVTHSNWGSDKNSRSLIYRSMRVQDVSPKNDWSLLRFWNGKSFGAPYPAYGFIYKT